MITISYDIIFFLVVLIYYCSICICLSTFLCLFYLIIKYVLFIIREEFYEMKKVKKCVAPLPHRLTRKGKNTVVVLVRILPPQ